jgi:uncharacterized membrane protein
MITSAFAYIALLLFLAGSLKLIESRSQLKIFQVLPAIVVLYFTVMVLSSLDVWQKTEAINSAYSALKTNILPAMIFLMLLNADLRQIKKLGSKIIFAFLASSLSIGVAFVLAYLLFLPMLEPESWKTFAALSGSWMGGTGNMAAIQMALDVPDSSMGYTLLIDSIDYAIWVMLLLALVPFAKHFDAWVGTDTSKLKQVADALSEKKQSVVGDQTTTLLFLLGCSLIVSVATQHLANILPTSTFFTTTTWTVLLVTIIGVCAALTPLSRLFGATELSNIMLFLIVSLIASRADFAELTQAPLYILMGLVILLFHGIMMVIFAKLCKFDLFTCGIASLANIGGVASAPILAAAYSRALIPIGVLMAMIGYVIGTGGGLLVGKVLFMFST